MRDGGYLNGCWLGIAGFLHGQENLRRKVKSPKWHKPGTIVSLEAIAPVILVLDVEVLPAAGT